MGFVRPPDDRGSYDRPSAHDFRFAWARHRRPPDYGLELRELANHLGGQVGTWRVKRHDSIGNVRLHIPRLNHCSASPAGYGANAFDLGVVAAGEIVRDLVEFGRIQRVTRF